MKIDLPLDDLKQYMGISPKPNDFEAYWEKSLKQLNEQSFEYDLIPAEFQTNTVECYHLYFIGMGGARIHCQLVKPKNQQEKGPGIVWFHGYTSNSGDWINKVAYAAEGITVLAMDCRGQGGLSEDNLQVQGNTHNGHIIRGLDDPAPEKLYYRNVFLDTVHAMKILSSMDHIDPDRIGAYGASQGGALSVVCAALEPTIKRIVAIYPFLSDYKRVWDMELDMSAYKEIYNYFRRFDPTHKREDEIFNKLGYIDIQHFANRIEAEVLWATSLIDRQCPPSTQFAAYNKIKSKKELIVFPEFGHENLPTLLDTAFMFFSKL